VIRFGLAWLSESALLTQNYKNAKLCSQNMTNTNKVAIIGAGSSGIAACKVLKQHGVPFDCFEAGDRVGGNWVYGNSNGVSSAYRSLHINT